MIIKIIKKYLFKTKDTECPKYGRFHVWTNDGDEKFLDKWIINLSCDCGATTYYKQDALHFRPLYKLDLSDKGKMVGE